MTDEKGKAPKGGDAGGKRRVTRLRKRLMIRFGEGKADRTAFTRNISRSGLFIHTNTMLKPGITIQVQITFPDRVVSHWARVVWAKQAPTQLAHVVDCGLGVHFIDPSPDWFDYFEQWKAKTGA